MKETTSLEKQRLANDWQLRRPFPPTVGGHTIYSFAIHLPIR
jgi:hypothetical protein